MSKRKNIKYSNIPFTYGPNYYSWGGDFKNALNLGSIKDTFSGANMASMLKNGLASGLGSAIGNIGGGLISGGLQSGAGNAIGSVGNTIGGIVSTVNPLAGGAVKAASGIIGGVTNALFGSKLNKEKIAEIEGINTQLNTLNIDDSSFDTIQNMWTSQDFGSNFTRSDIGKDGLFSNKAKNTFNRLSREQAAARNRALLAYTNAAISADTNNDLVALANFSAYGGPLNTYAEGGGIHIKSSKKGTFTAAAKERGKSVQEFASQVLANKENYSPAMVKKANFARNASKWKHGDGGSIKKKTFEDWYKTIPADRNDTTSYNLRRAYELAPYNELEAWRTSSIKDLKRGKNHLKSVYRNPDTGVYEFMKSKNHPTLHFETDWYNSNDPEAIKFRKDYDLDMSGDYYKYVPKKKAFGGPLFAYGAEWDNGITKVNNGGTHEQNPMEGVQMGISPEGIPNLVEEGEVIFNNYVFSNRLNVPKEVKDKYKLNKRKGLTFADAAEQLQKESEERPNDPISKRGLEAAMARLQQEQEQVRIEKNEDTNQYAHGGKMGILFDGLGDFSQQLPELPISEVIPKKFPYYIGEAGKQETFPDLPSFKNSYLTGLRYAPVVGAAIGIGQNLFSKPDYSSANAVLEAANQVGNYTPIGYTPIGNYLQYKPFDRNYYINKLDAQAGATRSAIMNASSPSRNAALLAADYNAQGRLGDLAKQAEEYNLAQRQAVETFNRQTDLSNAEMGLKAAMANQEAAMKARSGKLSGVAQAMAMRDAVDARRGASMSANLTNLFDSLGNIGIDEYNRRDRDFYISTMGAALPLSEYAYLHGRDATLKEYARRYGSTAAIQAALNSGIKESDLKKIFSEEDMKAWSKSNKSSNNKGGKNNG